MAFENGKLIGFETGESEGPKAESRIIADYSTSAQISRGELNAVKALTSRQFNPRGDMAKALRLVPLVDKLNVVLAITPPSSDTPARRRDKREMIEMPEIPQLDPNDPYAVDIAKRLLDIQAGMHQRDLDVYLASRVRTMSFVLDAFVPWPTFMVIPTERLSTVFIFVIDSACLLSETCLDKDHVRGYFGSSGADQIEIFRYFIQEELGLARGRIGYETGMSTYTLVPLSLFLFALAGRIGYETGMSTYTAEGWITHYEYQRSCDALPDFEFINAHDIVDRASIIKDEGTINRFHEAERIVDAGHQAAPEAIEKGGRKGMTETELAGIAALAMRR